MGKRVPTPGFGTKALAILLKVFPKKGPFSGLNFKVPTQPAEDLFVNSIDETVQSYRHLLRESELGTLRLANKDCDTGKNTAPGEYSLSDNTYAHLLNDLSDNNFKQTSPELKDDILAFYKNPNVPLVTKRKKKEWQRVQDQLQELKNASIVIVAGANSSAHEN